MALIALNYKPLNVDDLKCFEELQGGKNTGVVVFSGTFYEFDLVQVSLVDEVKFCKLKLFRLPSWENVLLDGCKGQKGKLWAASFATEINGIKNTFVLRVVVEYHL